MPKLVFSFTAGEFLDEELEYQPRWVQDGWEEYNPTAKYPFEWWIMV